MPKDNSQHGATGFTGERIHEVNRHLRRGARLGAQIPKDLGNWGDERDREDTREDNQPS